MVVYVGPLAIESEVRIQFHFQLGVARIFATPLGLFHSPGPGISFQLKCSPADHRISTSGSGGRIPPVVSIWCRSRRDKTPLLSVAQERHGHPKRNGGPDYFSEA